MCCLGSCVRTSDSHLGFVDLHGERRQVVRHCTASDAGVGIHAVLLVVPTAETHRVFGPAAATPDVPISLSTKADLRAAWDDDEDVASLKPEVVSHLVGRDAALERDAHDARRRFDGLGPLDEPLFARGFSDLSILLDELTHGSVGDAAVGKRTSE